MELQFQHSRNFMELQFQHSRNFMELQFQHFRNFMELQFQHFRNFVGLRCRLTQPTMYSQKYITVNYIFKYLLISVVGLVL